MRVKHIVGVSDQGVSRPYQCHDENGELRWCKGNHTGLRAIMSEWLCARMGQSLDLPVPPCDVLYLDPQCFDRWRADRASLPVLVTAANPYVFASLNVDFLESAWSEMPVAWTDVGSEVLSLESVLKMLDVERW